MRRSLVVLVLLVVATVPGAAQTCREGLGRQVLEHLVRRTFANLTSPQSANNIGTYAAIDTKEASATLNLSHMFGNGSVLGAKVSGGATEGLLPIFSSSKINKTLALDVQYNALAGLRNLTYEEGMCAAYQARLRQVSADSTQKHIDIRARYAALKRYVERTDSTAVRLERFVAAANHSLDSLSRLPEWTKVAGPHSRVDQFVGDSLRAERDKALNARRLQGAVLAAASPGDTATLILSLSSWRDAERQKAIGELTLAEYRFGWFSFGFGLQNAAFQLFDPALAFGSQVTDTSYLTKTVRAQYSVYNYSLRPFRSYYFSISAALAVSNNRDELAKVAVTETTPVGTDGSTRREVTRQLTPYAGSYSEGLKSLSFAGDAYYFLFNQNRAAVHLYPSVVVRDENDPFLNLGLGVMIAAQNAAKTGNTVNAELYVAVDNATNANDPETSRGKRTSVGVRLTFPIQF